GWAEGMSSTTVEGRWQPRRWARRRDCGCWGRLIPPICAASSMRSLIMPSSRTEKEKDLGSSRCLPSLDQSRRLSWLHAMVTGIEYLPKRYLNVLGNHLAES